MEKNKRILLRNCKENKKNLEMKKIKSNFIKKLHQKQEKFTNERK